MSGDDMLLGEAGADHLKGGGGDDALFGGDGADKLVGGRGDDEMTGGDGADRFVFGRRSGEDVVTDLNFAEGDALKLRGFRLVDGEADLIDLATRLNQDGRQNTSATVEGDDLRLEIGSRDILLEDAAAGWSGDSLFA